MARYTGPKNKQARREGLDLGLKTVGSSAQQILQRRLSIAPGQHGSKRMFRRKTSDYYIRLREKQKAKNIYGLLEKQFRHYVERAVKEAENTLDELVAQLEQRLDNIVFRLHFAPTRAAARQLVTHRHVRVDDKIVNIPSYQVTAGQVIKLSSKAQNIPAIMSMLQEDKPAIPNWLTRDKFSGKIRVLPNKESVTEVINWQLIIEYYTR